MRRQQRRCGARGAACVIVETATALASEPTGEHQFLLDQRRLEASIAEGGVEHGTGNGEIDIVTDEIHQFERPHRKPAALAQQGVERFQTAGTLAQHPERLGVVRSRHPIDDETGRRARPNRHLAPRPRGVDQVVDQRRVGGEAADYLDQRHARRGIEEMQPHHAFRPRQAGRDRRDGNRRGIGGQNRFRTQQGLQATKKIALDLEILDHRFDDQPRRLQILQLLGGSNAVEDRLAFLVGELAFLDQEVQILRHGLTAFRHRVGAAIEQEYRVAGGCGHLGDAAAHGAGANDGDIDAGNKRAHGRIRRARSPGRCLGRRRCTWCTGRSARRSAATDFRRWRPAARPKRPADGRWRWRRRWH